MNDDHNILLSSSIKPVQIDVHDLIIGMYVCKLDKPWLESRFLFQGFELKNQADIDAVREECSFVFIDIEKQTRTPKFQNKHTEQQLEKRSTAPQKLSSFIIEKQSAVPKKQSSFIQEFDQAAFTYRQTSDLVSSFMEDVQLGKAINVAAAKKVVTECVDSVLRATDALLWMTQLKHRDLYTAQHSMNVCILSIALGKHLNIAAEELNNLGLCGMLHDMGKMKVPLDILNKPEKLEPDELKIMQSHAAKGGELLTASKGIYAGAIDVAHSHHERLDGKGYPRQLTDTQISLYSRIVTIADMYDAVSSDRVYKKGRSHLEAIKIMTSMCGTQLDSVLTYKFIECLGIYPAGSVVELNSGEVAVVLEVNPKHKLKPKILILLDKNKNHQPLQIIDLFLMTGTDINNRTIKNTISPSLYDIDLKEYYEQGLIGYGHLAKGF
jgi:HD-GYP domain-containing protein (c-di-GMP phosphodiesterase class II)